MAKIKPSSPDKSETLQLKGDSSESFHLQTGSVSVNVNPVTAEEINRTKPTGFQIIRSFAVFFLKKCWMSCSAAVFVIFVIYWCYGGFIALILFVFAITGLRSSPSSHVVVAHPPGVGKPTPGPEGPVVPDPHIPAKSPDQPTAAYTKPSSHSGFLFQLGDFFLYHPDQPPQSRLYVPLPSLFGLPAESVFLKTADGVKIHAFFIKQDPSIIGHVSTILYFHGNAGNIGHRLPNAKGLYQCCGCNILLVEYRGYGHSEGSPSEEGLYLDAQAGMKYLLQLPYIDKTKIIVFGRSLGGAVAIDLVTHSEFAKHVLVLIVENTFTSIPDIAKEMFNWRFLHWLPLWAFKNQYLSLDKIKKIKRPSLFVSGKDDAIIPDSMMKALCQHCGSSLKRFQSFEYGTHNETWRCFGYYRIINLFIDDIMLAQKELVQWSE